jgi:hypothetical protein
MIAHCRSNPEPLEVNGRPCDDPNICCVAGNSVDRNGFEVFCMSSFIRRCLASLSFSRFLKLRPERIEQA